MNPYDKKKLLWEKRNQRPMAKEVEIFCCKCDIFLIFSNQHKSTITLLNHNSSYCLFLTKVPCDNITYMLKREKKLFEK
jgi:hypothetical protein